MGGKSSYLPLEEDAENLGLESPMESDSSLKKNSVMEFFDDQEDIDSAIDDLEKKVHGAN